MAFRLNRLEGFALALLTLLLALSAGLYLYGQLAPRTESAGVGGDFTLQGADGAVSLSDFRGKAVVLMFGYTSCPDVCPSGLANVAAGLERLSEAEQARVQPIFISVDPGRDSPDKLKAYCEYFHPRILGLTGEQSQIDPVVDAYGAFYRLVETPDSAMDYTVDHSARLYLIGPEGRVRALLYHNSTPGKLAEALKSLL